MVLAFDEGEKHAICSRRPIEQVGEDAHVQVRQVFVPLTGEIVLVRRAWPTRLVRQSQPAHARAFPQRSDR